RHAGAGADEARPGGPGDRRLGARYRRGADGDTLVPPGVCVPAGAQPAGRAAGAAAGARAGIAARAPAPLGAAGVGPGVRGIGEVSGKQGFTRVSDSAARTLV